MGVMGVKLVFVYVFVLLCKCGLMCPAWWKCNIHIIIRCIIHEKPLKTVLISNEMEEISRTFHENETYFLYLDGLFRIPVTRILLGSTH